MPPAGVSTAVRRALVLISEHPGVDEVGAPRIDEASGAVTVDAMLTVNLPNEWRRLGESPSGVRLREEVRFEFAGRFPMDPPKLSLRADFNRNLPHMQPWLADGRPVPCIYDGHLAELLHSEGLAGILNQTSLWLERAALGTLIDPEQGWEPVRRDSFDDILVADAGYLQGLVDRRGGHRFMKIEYLKFFGIDGTPIVYGQVASETVSVNRKTFDLMFGEAEIARDLRLKRGKSLALVVWSGKHPSGKPIVNEIYLPETVESVDDLKKRAALYGCRRELDDGLNWLERCVLGRQGAGFVHDGGDPLGPAAVCSDRKCKPDRAVSVRRRRRFVPSVCQRRGNSRSRGRPPPCNIPGSSRSNGRDRGNSGKNALDACWCGAVWVPRSRFISREREPVRAWSLTSRKWHHTMRLVTRLFRLLVTCRYSGPVPRRGYYRRL